MKALVIGYGSIGKRHAQLLKRTAEVTEVAIVTRQEVHDYFTYRALDLISDLDKYDLYLIATETSLHREQLHFLVTHLNHKTILVEKPLFEKDCEIPVGNNQVFVAYNLRFHPVLQELKQQLDGEKLLSVNILTGQYLPDWRPQQDYRKSYSASASRGGGVLLDLSHELDYLIWLFGFPRIIGAIHANISVLEISSDDYVAVIGTTDKNVHFSLNLDYLSKIPLRQVVVQTELKTIYADLIGGKLKEQTASGELKTKSFACSNRDLTYENMHHAILNGRIESLCSYEEGVAVMRAIEAIRQSSGLKD